MLPAPIPWAASLESTVHHQLAAHRPGTHCKGYHAGCRATAACLDAWRACRLAATYAPTRAPLGEKKAASTTPLSPLDDSWMVQPASRSSSSAQRSLREAYSSGSPAMGPRGYSTVSWAGAACGAAEAAARLLSAAGLAAAGSASADAVGALRSDSERKDIHRCMPGFSRTAVLHAAWRTDKDTPRRPQSFIQTPRAGQHGRFIAATTPNRSEPQPTCQDWRRGAP